MLKTFDEIKKEGFDFKEFETLRKSIVIKRRKALLLPVTIGILITLIGFILILNSFFTIGTIVFLTGLLLLMRWTVGINEKYKSIIKNSLINNLLKKISDNFSFQTLNQEGIGYFQEKITESGFMDSFFTSTSKDVIKGKILASDFALGNVRINQTSYSTSTVFEGVFAFIETENNYPFTTIIPYGYGATLGGLSKKLDEIKSGRTNLKTITFDQDSDFNKKYAVWAYDENMANQIVSPKLRAYLKKSIYIYLAFNRNLIFFGRNNQKNLFKIKLRKKITEPIIRRFYDDFSKYYNMIEEILVLINNDEK